MCDSTGLVIEAAWIAYTFWLSACQIGGTVNLAGVGPGDNSGVRAL